MNEVRLRWTWWVVVGLTVVAAVVPLITWASSASLLWRVVAALGLLVLMGVTKLATRPGEPARMNHLRRQLEDPELAAAVGRVSGGRPAVIFGRRAETVDVARRRVWDSLFGSAPLIMLACVWLVPGSPDPGPVGFRVAAAVGYAVLVGGLALARITIARIDRAEREAPTATRR